jgi:hypothetical protein
VFVKKWVVVGVAIWLFVSLSQIAQGNFNLIALIFALIFWLAISWIGMRIVNALRGRPSGAVPFAGAAAMSTTFDDGATDRTGSSFNSGSGDGTVGSGEPGGPGHSGHDRHGGGHSSDSGDAFGSGGGYEGPGASDSFGGGSSGSDSGSSDSGGSSDSFGGGGGD